MEIKYTAVAVSKSNSSTATNLEKENSIEKGIPLYINIIATLEGNKCTVVSTTDNTKTVPYQVASNGKYTFKVSGTYNGKTINENKDVTVNQYMSAQGVVQYDAGDWTEEEIQELKEQRLYMINREKTYNYTFNVNDPNSGLNLTFGGFTYKSDTENEEDIESGNIITSRNQSVTPQSGNGKPKYSGWQILESKEENEKTYVKKIIHAGSPENFVYTPADGNYPDARAVYLLSGGMKYKSYNVISTGETINPRSFHMYVDKNQESIIAETKDKDGNTIKDIHLMTYDEATNVNYYLRETGAYYWLATADRTRFF